MYEDPGRDTGCDAVLGHEERFNVITTHTPNPESLEPVLRPRIGIWR